MDKSWKRMWKKAALPEIVARVNCLKYFHPDVVPSGQNWWKLLKFQGFSENLVDQVGYNQNSFFLQSLSTILQNQI